MSEELERRLRELERQAEMNRLIALLAVSQAYRKSRRKSIGDRLWDLI